MLTDTAHLLAEAEMSGHEDEGGGDDMRGPD